MRKRIFHIALCQVVTSLLILCRTHPVISQPIAIDSLNKVLSISKEDTNKVNTLYEVYGAYITENNLDSAMAYASHSPDLARRINYKRGIEYGLMNTGWVLLSRFDYESARQRFREAIEFGSDIQTEIGDVLDDDEINGTLVKIKVPVNLSIQKA